MSVQIIIDSASDITPTQAADLGVRVLPLKTIFGQEEYLDGVTMTHRDFYEKLIETEVHPTTSQIAPYEYQAAFQAVQEAGDTALCITLSGKLSGSYQSAHIAAAEFPGVVTLVDSENVAIGAQLLIRLALRLRDQGMTAPEIAAVLETEKKKICLIALLDTLEYLKKGGRISATTALAGTLLSIKPVVALENGEVVTIGKARGSKNGQNFLREYLQKQGIDYTRDCLVAYTGLSDALLQKYLTDSQELHAPFGHPLPISTIGSTIGTHIGPNAIAVAFFRK